MIAEILMRGCLDISRCEWSEGIAQCIANRADVSIIAYLIYADIAMTKHDGTIISESIIVL